MTLALDLLNEPLPHFRARAGVAKRLPMVVFTTRKGGLSAGAFGTLNLGDRTGDDLAIVRANERRLRESFAVPPGALYTVRQEHGTKIVRITHGADPGEIANQEADLLVTNLPGAFLTMKFADCLPLVVWSARGAAIGIAHCGWRGIAGGAVEKLLSAFAIEFALDPPELCAALGPCIGKCCFTVGMEVVTVFLRRFSDLPDLSGLVESGPGGGRIDLPGIVRAILRERGVADERIVAAGLCTSCRDDLFFSHRRDRGRTGRIACIAGILPEAS